MLLEEDPLGLLHVGGGKPLHVLLGEARAGGRLAGGVAHLGREVADDQHRGVAQLLELAELAQHHGEAEVDVGGSRIDAQLRAQGTAGFELAAEVGLGDELDGAGAQDPQLFFDGDGAHRPRNATRVPRLSRFWRHHALPWRRLVTPK